MLHTSWSLREEKIQYRNHNMMLIHSKQYINKVTKQELYQNHKNDWSHTNHVLYIHVCFGNILLGIKVFIPVCAPSMSIRLKRSAKLYLYLSNVFLFWHAPASGKLHLTLYNQSRTNSPCNSFLPLSLSFTCLTGLTGKLFQQFLNNMSIETL